MGNVASTMGTAPRRPAHDEKTCSRHGTRNQMSDTATETGRLSSRSTSPITIPATTSPGIWLGVTSRPSRTNRPICANQPSPSAKDLVALRWGSPELASTSAERYAAMNPLAWTLPAAAKASMPSPNVASGYRPDAGNATRRSTSMPSTPTASPIAMPAPNLYSTPTMAAAGASTSGGALNIKPRSTGGASLKPDSASSSPATRRGNGTTRSTENIAAASVDETIAPSSRASCQFMPSSQCAPAAVTSVDTTMPTVASTAA